MFGVTPSYSPAVRRIGRLERTAARWGSAIQDVAGAVKGNRVDAYWFVRVPNFGDLITPLLLERYGFTPVHGFLPQVRLVSTGSVLEKVPEDFEGTILGPGFMWAKSARRFPRARVLALRGALTLERTGASPQTPLGDPGLLVPRSMRRRQAKQFAVGIVPHYVDKADPRVAALLRRYPKEVLAIDVQQDPLVVLSEIDRCEGILSSSLHGLVAADALGIPGAWTILSGKVGGEGFKFRDHNSALHVDRPCISITGGEHLRDLVRQLHAPPSSVAEVAGRMDQVFCSLRGLR